MYSLPLISQGLQPSGIVQQLHQACYEGSSMPTQVFACQHAVAQPTLQCMIAMKTQHPPKYAFVSLWLSKWPD